MARKPRIRSWGALVFAFLAAALAAGLALAGGLPAAAQADRACLSCHARPGARAPVDPAALAGSAHAKTSCVACHAGVGEMPPHSKPAEAGCGGCHGREAKAYGAGAHAAARARGESKAARCQDCHKPGHAIRGRTDPASSVHPFNLPETCGGCHSDPETAHEYGFPPGILEAYYATVHGIALRKSGLVVSAVCNDCHAAHDVRRRGDPASPINRANLTRTCGRCHEGIARAFALSIHGRALERGNPLAPVCSNCHSAHAIVRADQPGYRLDAVRECGDCHQKYFDTYKDTYHGKVTWLGYAKTAKCSDCHGSHGILPHTDPRSNLSAANRASTCRACHPGAAEGFTSYIAHQARKDQFQFKVVFVTVLFMSALLIGTFSFFGAHTLLWLSRIIRDMRRAPRAPEAGAAGGYVLRFRLFHRVLHGIVIVSFLGLVFTGMPLKFAHADWAAALLRLMGGFEAAGSIHRFCALLTFLYFGLHLAYVARYLAARPDFELLGPDSMLPRRKDLADFAAQVRWFLGRGPQPRFDRWTYWEKFDYWAVFWGVSIIGSSGLMLWFPEFFSRLLPGWAFNVATVIHSDEALLAAGFIFSIHFFNTHLRPGKFPMDDVIFTGRVSVEELKEERPEEHARLLRLGLLEAARTEAPSPELKLAARALGFTALGLGLAAVALIAFSLLHIVRGLLT